MNSATSIQMLDDLSERLNSYVNHSEIDEKIHPELNEALLSLFTLLFDFTEPSQVKVSEKCGHSIVRLLSDKKVFLSPKHEEIVTYSLLM